jgi:glycerophosphoryl diester phosphodiesterase
MARRYKVSLAALVFAGAAVAALRRRAPGPVRGGWPANVAHRGLSARLPENTLSAFRAALEAGAGGLELDVRVTHDGHPVVMHDATVDRTTDGFGAVAGMTLEAVRGLSAGQPGEKVPTLREVFEEFPSAAVNLDIKDWDLPGAEEVVLGVLRELGVAKRVLVASADHRVLRRFRRAAGGEFYTGASRREIAVFYAMSLLRLERLIRPAYTALQVPVYYGPLRLLTPRFVRAARSLGVRVDVWTVNDPAQMREVLDLGADAVMTDRPEVLAKVLAERASSWAGLGAGDSLERRGGIC